ncbi:MAG: serine--tRNA ligase [Hyphomonadaceae bacterium]|nr:serine--tRNA ligase [Hyphomonadaceae bacterium]
MHDIRAIRENPAAYEKAWGRRSGIDAKSVVAEILSLDTEVRKAIQSKEAGEQARNAKSKEIGKAKASKDETLAAKLMAEVAEAKATIDEAGKAEAEAIAKRDYLLASLPNLPMDDVPDGKDEHANKVMRTVGTPRQFNFQPKDHADIGEGLKMMDFEVAARMSGARFVVLKEQLAKLERALTAFMLDVQTVENAYSETAVPLLVKEHAMRGTGQLPKFAEDLFQTKPFVDPSKIGRTEIDLRQATKNLFKQRAYAESVRLLLEEAGQLWSDDPDKATRKSELAAELKKRLVEMPTHEDLKDHYTDVGELLDFLRSDFYLIPTAEVSLTNIVREQILDVAQLPMRMTAATPCFRSEAGSAGRDTKGMIRMHQFIKVELVSITKPEDSDAELERMTRCAEGILERLELPYRTMMLCAGDMGFGARKTYDLEVWLPSQNTYREISSCSTCGDFQARRMDARFRRAQGEKPEFVHTLNGSGLAVGRTLVAILENYQEEDGRVRVPKALIPYMGNLEVIG